MESPLVKKQRRNGNCPLPQDLILQEILPRLPTNSVIRFKSTSKTWLTLISQHASLIAAAAAKHHDGEMAGSLITGRYMTDKYSISNPRLFFLGHNDLNAVEIDISYICKKTCKNFLLIGSCNGLVCLKLIHSYGKLYDLVLWNPATREVNYLLTGEPFSWITYYALGYDIRSGVEKVLRWKDSFGDGRSIEATSIFSKKSGHWKPLKSYTRTDPEDYFFWDKSYSLTVEGAIYWKLKPYKVMSFDLSKEEFGEFEGPINELDHSLGDTSYYNLISWKGSLAAVFAKPGGVGIQVLLKNKDSSGWKTISTIQLSVRELQLGRLFRGDEIIPISYRDNSYGGKEILYDLVTQKNRDLDPVLEKIYCYYICQHFYTLNSPN